MNTTQEINTKLNLAFRDLASAKTPESRERINKKIKILKYRRDIARIQDLIAKLN